MIKLALELAGLRLPFAKAIRVAAELGVSAVVIDGRGEISATELSRTGLRQVRKMLDDVNLRVAAVAFPTRRGYATEAELERRIAATKAAMEFAYHLGARVVVNHIGRVPPPDSDSWKLLVEVLTDLGKHSEKAGAMLAAETGLESGEELARLLSALPEGSLGGALNPAKLVLGGFSPSAAAESLAPWIVHAILADAAGGPLPGMGEPRTLGTGDADIPALLGKLDEIGYRGYFAIQVPPTDDPLAAASAAVEYMKRF